MFWVGLTNLGGSFLPSSRRAGVSLRCSIGSDGAKTEVKKVLRRDQWGKSKALKANPTDVSKMKCNDRDRQVGTKSIN